MDTILIRDNTYEAKKRIETLTKKVEQLRAALQMIAGGTSSCYQFYQYVASEALKIEIGEHGDGL